MSKFSASALEKRLNRKIGRRQQLARWGRALIAPTICVAFYFGRRSPWIVLLGIALFLLETIAIIQGELLRCPRCDAQLVVGRGWFEEFTGTCPECECPID